MEACIEPLASGITPLIITSPSIWMPRTKKTAIYWVILSESLRAVLATSLSLLQVIFPTQGSNPGLLHCRWILYYLSHNGSPRILECVAYPFSSWCSWSRKWTGVSCIAGRFFTRWVIRKPTRISWDINGCAIIESILWTRFWLRRHLYRRSSQST